MTLDAIFRELKDLALDTNFENVPSNHSGRPEIFIDNAELNIDPMMEKMYASTASK